MSVRVEIGQITQDGEVQNNRVFGTVETKSIFLHPDGSGDKIIVDCSNPFATVTHLVNKNHEPKRDPRAVITFGVSTVYRGKYALTFTHI